MVQSCIKVAMDFVSPENLQECLFLTEEFRLLPKMHRAKEDKLEVHIYIYLYTQAFMYTHLNIHIPAHMYDMRYMCVYLDQLAYAWNYLICICITNAGSYSTM